MREKGVKLLQAQKLVQYLRECEDVLDWINDKVYYYLRLLCSQGKIRCICMEIYQHIVAGVQADKESF